MKPKEYIDSFRGSSPLKTVLTPAQLVEASIVVDAGYDFIARKIGQQYNEMTPEAVKATESLVVMMCVFIEHANNPGLLRRAMAANG